MLYLLKTFATPFLDSAQGAKKVGAKHYCRADLVGKYLNLKQNY